LTNDFDSGNKKFKAKPFKVKATDLRLTQSNPQFNFSPLTTEKHCPCGSHWMKGVINHGDGNDDVHIHLPPAPARNSMSAEPKGENLDL